MTGDLIAILGVGHFGKAVARGFLDRSFIASDQLVLVQRQDEINFNCRVVRSLQEITDPLTALLICVRPQDFPKVDTNPKICKEALILSVMAGVAISQVQAVFGAQVVRAMPNIAAPIGSGVTVYKVASNLTQINKTLLERILAHWGVAIPVDDEELLDAATAVSGSGPGIIYWFLDELKGAAKELGFSNETAELLVRYTARGALSHWEASAEPLPSLIQKVASKKGTTEAALNSLKSEKVNEAIRKAIIAAAERCRGLRK